MKQKRLKKQLGEGYVFERRLSSAVAANLLNTLDGSNHFLVAASLSVGVVKLEAVVYWDNGNPEFKAIRNAVIQEAVKAVPEGPVTMPLRTSLPNDEDKDDGEKDDCKTVHLKTEIDSAALVFEPIRPAGPMVSYDAAGRLLRSLARMLQTKTQAEEKEMAALDRKQRQQQAHKKQAMGIRD